MHPLNALRGPLRAALLVHLDYIDSKPQFIPITGPTGTQGLNTEFRTSFKASLENACPNHW